MKILQICAAYKPAYIYGGPTMSVSRLSEELVEAGHEIEVFTTTANGADELDVKPGEPTIVEGVTVTYFKRLSGDHTHYSPDLLNALRRRIRDFDIVHIHAWWNFVSLFTSRITIKSKIPLLISPRGTLSDYSFNNKNSLIKRLIHSLFGKAVLSRSYLHVTSDRELNAIETLLEPKGIFNIPNFISLPENLKVSPRREAGPLKLIFLSRIDKKKGMELLFQALKTIAIDYRLTIAGSGDEEYVISLKDIALEYGLAPKIDWIGFRTDDKYEILQEHDLFVLPSYDENFGNAVIESLITGTAVLISNQVGVSKYVEERKLGWVCDQQINSLRKNIIAISENRNELMRIRKSAPGIVRRDFSPEALRTSYIAAYKTILGNG